MLHVLTWWLLIQLLGLAALPLAFRLFRWLPGRGYTFAKPLGLLLASYILWLGGSLGYLQNTSGGALLALALTATISTAIYTWRRKDAGPSLWSFLRRRWRLVLTTELLFAVGFAAWAAVRAYAPDKIMTSGGEKFMEIAFLNAILKSPSFPPRDPWLSGFAISYYYFGYVMMALLTRLSGVLPGVGFELYNALVFALTLTGAFGVVNNLVAGSSHTHSDGGPALRFGLLGALFVAVMGNLEGLLEALYARGALPESFWAWIDIPDLTSAGQVTGSFYPGHGWWWWRASRVLRDRNLLREPMPLNPIDEFPFFSFLLGDNHPHVMALPFVLLAIGLAFNLLRGTRRRRRTPGNASIGALLNPLASAFGGDWTTFLLYGLALGALGFLNTWDLPIYIGLTVLTYVAGCYADPDRSLSVILPQAIILGVAFILASVLLYLPFYVSFSSQAGGVVPYLLAPTRLPQYLVMFGPFVFIAAVFLTARLSLTRLHAKSSGPTRAGATARWWAVVGIGPILLLVIVLGVALLAPFGQAILQDLLARPEIQQAVGNNGPTGTLRAILAGRLRDPWLFLLLSLLISTAGVGAFLSRRTSERVGEDPAAAQFASLLLLCGLGLTYVTEFVYLRDSFGVRMNTIFKFYYQAWIMLGCAGAFSTWWILRPITGRPATGRPATSRLASRPVIHYAFLTVAVLLVSAAMVYPVIATYSRVDGFSHRPVLNGAAPIARNNPDDWAAIEWLHANAENGTVILEAPGKSYDYEGRISAFTGHPAVLGWALHESQWRGNYVEQGKREPDIATIYTTPYNKLALNRLHKWAVDYVVVGPPERRYVQDLCAEGSRRCGAEGGLAKFDTLLTRVFAHGQTTLYRVPTP